ncbi:MAG: UvrB/UvrC motif-containing protein [Phycisphaerales bacterium]|nr:UvrB/UvrC motif-containing protein [Phycisphaerales bacterium]
MKDHKGIVIYVGKASKLCDRVASYFLPSTDLGPWKNKLLDEVHSFVTFTTETAWEALLAENRLIKDIHPIYNAAQKDDRTFPYLIITMREDFPRVFVSRNPTGIKNDGTKDPRYSGATILGPFTSPGALHKAVDALQAVFRYRTCSLDILENDDKNRFFRPCLLAAIGKCSAPCNNSISKAAYREDIGRFVRFIKTKRATMIRELRAEMEAASGEMDFERAAALRDQLLAIEKLDHRASTSDQWQPESEIGYQDPLKSCASLQRTLGMDKPIRCVEGFDIAHLQGNETVASKVCFVDGRPFKQEYRRFRIKSFQNLPGGRANDDFQSMREVISRRYREAGAGHELYPDVVLIDGGIGQLHAAMEAFEQLDVQPPMVVSLAKKEELIYTMNSSEPIKLGKNNPGLRLLMQVRDESHRFAQHYHHILRRKKTLGED